MQWLATVDDQTWVDVITKASLLAAAGFGLLGLLTDYKKDGRITRWGKVAAGGIVLSAVLSILSGSLKNNVQARASAAANRKERIERDVQAGRFARQIAQLQSLNERMAGVNRDSRTLIANMEDRSPASRSSSTMPGAACCSPLG
jgi:hypothetical protein